MGSLGLSRALVAMSLAAFGAACVNTTVIKANSTPAVKTTEEIPEHQLLDVGIAIFDPGVPEDEEELEEELIFPDVRKAEARYMPYLLKNTMQSTGHWGAVRVIPRESNSVDLMVETRILESDGERLELAVTATDSTGSVWLEKEYKDIASKLSYRDSLSNGEDPFQDIYNAIANDLAAAYEARPPKALANIRQVSELRFAQQLSPEVFEDYLRVDEDGKYDVRRLPAYSDPMVARMQRIREREYMFLDTLDGHYANFREDIGNPYEEWRKYSYEEVIALRELQRQARLHKIIGAASIAGGVLVDSDSNLGRAAQTAAVYGGLMAFKTGMDMKSQSRIHAEALRELGGSFEAEVTPFVTEIEGQTVTLTGSVDAQFEEWQDLLRDIYTIETGRTLEPRVDVQSEDAQRNSVGDL